MDIVHHRVEPQQVTTHIALVVDDRDTNAWLPLAEDRFGGHITIIDFDQALQSDFDDQALFGGEHRKLVHPEMPATLAEALHVSAGHNDGKTRIFVRTSDGGQVASTVACLEMEWLNTRKVWHDGRSSKPAPFHAKIFNIVGMSPDVALRQLEAAYSWALCASVSYTHLTLPTKRIV